MQKEALETEFREAVMLNIFNRFTGRSDVGDIDTKDNMIVNVLFFAGFAVTVIIAVWAMMYWLL